MDLTGLKCSTYSKYEIEKLKKPLIYFIHDNGGRPFMVKLFQGKIEVYQIKEGVKNYNEKENEEDNFGIIVYEVNKFEKVFIGEDNTENPYLRHNFSLGNTVLINLEDKKYVFITQSIISFQTSGKITGYLSDIGNNDVSYPIAFDNNNLYFLCIDYCYRLENRLLPKTYVLSATNGYELYDFVFEKTNKIFLKPLDELKTIVPRVW